MKKKGEQEESKEKYLWLDPSDERKYMMNKEILDKFIDLDKSCIMEKEKREVINMLYNYKEAFSLRDEIGTCPNIVVESEVTD